MRIPIPRRLPDGRWIRNQPTLRPNSANPGWPNRDKRLPATDGCGSCSPRTLLISCASQLDCCAKCREDVLTEPWILFFPHSRSPRRMGERKVFGEINTEVFHPRRNRAGPKNMLLGVASNKQREAYRRQQSQELIAPQMRTFRSRRSVTAIQATGIAKTHRDDGDTAFVVKLIS